MNSTRWWLVGFVAAALALRIAFLAADPHPVENAGLSADQGEMARNIVDHGRWFVINPRASAVVGPRQHREGRLVDPAAIDYSAADRSAQYSPQVLQPVGEAVVLAGLWTVSGDERYIYVQVLQVLLDAAMVPLVFWISLWLYRRRTAALIAAGLYAAFLPIAALTRIPHLDTWGVVFTISITALLLRALDGDRRIPWLVAAGVATGLGVYFRPAALLIPLVMGFAALPSYGWRRSLLFAGIPLLVAGGLMLPWTIRNYDTFHRFIPTRIGTGQNLWEGLGEIKNDFGAALDDGLTSRQVHQVRPDLRYGTPAYDDYLKDKAVEAIKQHPTHYLRVVARRVAKATIAMQNPTWIEATDPALLRPSTGTTLHALTTHPWDGVRLAVYRLLEPLVFLIALITLIITRREWRRHVFLIAVVAASLAPYIALHFEPRYGLATSFAYMVLVGLGAESALRWIGRRRERAQEDASASGDRGSPSAPSAI
jgi:4-amino-4-deoxy-L-arabinose transferase-like glycosyltransferase